VYGIGTGVGFRSRPGKSEAEAGLGRWVSPDLEDGAEDRGQRSTAVQGAEAVPHRLKGCPLVRRISQGSSRAEGS